jgi:glycosyltransferase involved in cell wall biosynthesis
MPNAVSADRRPAVCIVGHKYYPEHNHLRRDARALVAAGYDVSLVGLRQAGQPLREKLDGVMVYRLPVDHRRGGPLRYGWEYLLFMTLAFLVLGVLHLRKRFRVVEVVNMPDVLVICTVVPKLLGARIILNIFDNMPELLSATSGLPASNPRVRVLALLERLCASYADHVIVTQELARRVVARRGVRPSKISVVLNGPDEQVFGLRPPRSRERPADRFTIVTHGTVLERFGIQVLVEALPALEREIPGLQVEIIGAGEYLSRIEALVNERGVGHLVEIHGWVPPSALVPRLARAQLGYVGMLCDLMLSNKLMEYAALGIPALVARWPTYEHYFPDDAVSYFPPGDAQALADVILRLYRQPDLALAQAERAFELYQRYRWARQRGLYLGVYASLLPPSAGRAVASISPSS